MYQLEHVGDSLLALQELPDNAYDFIFTDPPYYYPASGTKNVTNSMINKFSKYGNPKYLATNDNGATVDSSIFLGDKTIDHDAYFKQFIRVARKRLIIIFSGR